MQQKRTWKQVDGVLLLDKPGGMTSNDALQKARRLFSAAKAGHTGTLDPMATGLLPLCFGEATKFSADLLDADKTYEAQVLLGITTDTGDREGQVLETRPVSCTEADLRQLLPRFMGEIQQIPPMYSALKRDGRPLYELAREGKEVERQPRQITIHALELLAWDGPSFTLRVCCSKGTYIRVLAEDIGKALGCGAHLTALRRTQVGPLSLERAVTLETLMAQEEAGRGQYLGAVDTLLNTLPEVVLTAEEVSRFAHGNPVDAPTGITETARVYGAGRLLGVGMLRADGRLWPKRLIAGGDAQQA